MKILICDDSDNSINDIQNLLDKYENTHSVKFETTAFKSGEELIHKTESFDIAFVDIEMPGVNGLALTKHLKTVNPNIIIFIVTSFNGYLDDAMDLNVFRYLSKPVDGTRFNKGLDTALKLYRQNSESIIIETSDGTHYVSSGDILCIAIDKRKTKVVTVKGEYISGENLSFWKGRTDALGCFVQPHYSFLVNMKHITDFTKTEITLSGGLTVPISRGHYAEFRKAFFEFMGVSA